MTETRTLTVDPTNKEQAQAWDGGEGAYRAGNAEHFDRAVAAYHGQFMAAASISGSERVLDIGCGTGQTTRDAALAAASGFALGVDLSARMLQIAREAAAREGVANVTFEQGDAQTYPFNRAGFDVAISRTGAMFFGDPINAFANIDKALRPSGRLVLLSWQEPAGNEWIREFSTALAAGRHLPEPPLDAPGPFGLAAPDHVKAVLDAAGFTAIDLHARFEPMWFGHDVDDAERFVLGLLGWMLEGLDSLSREQARDNLRATLSDHETGQGVLYESATWTIRAARP